jgi:starvation-inducible DNA-binding protein
MKNDIDAGLSALLADHQVLYQKLRAFHWTVKGPAFFELHAKFEALYGEAAEKVDALAERILARGGKPPCTLREALALARLKEDAGTAQAADQVRAVLADLESLRRPLRELARTAGEAGDIATADLLDGYADGQEKTAWMLRAYLAA